MPDATPIDAPPPPPALPADFRPFVVIATLNERENIERMVTALFTLETRVELVLVDDASPDGTVAAAREKAAEQGDAERLHTIERAGKLGYGTAMAEGIHRAKEEGASHIFTMDADFSHDPQVLPELMRKLIDERADVVIGSRYIGGIRVLNWPMFRLFLSVFANFYARMILGLKITDATSGYRGYRVEVFDQVDLSKIHSRGYAFLVEGIYRIVCKGFDIVEAPITYSERREGQSKMSKWIILEAAFRPWWLRFLRLIRML